MNKKNHSQIAILQIHDYIIQIIIQKLIINANIKVLLH